LAADLEFGHYGEAKMSIERTVPRDIGEGCKRDSRPSRLARPRAHAVDQGAPHPGALVLRADTDLFDVGGAVYDLDNDVTDRLVGFVDRHPTATPGRVFGEGVHGGRLIVGHAVQADLPEALAGEALDPLQ
jgi:hypothetical protein